MRAFFLFPLFCTFLLARQASKVFHRRARLFIVDRDSQAGSTVLEPHHVIHIQMEEGGRCVCDTGTNASPWEELLTQWRPVGNGRR